MNNIIKYSILYYYKKFNYKIIGILLFILFSFIIYGLNDFINSNIQNKLQKNTWDLYSFLYIDSSMLVDTMIFISLYIVFSCFQNNKKEIFIKIRSNNFFIWYTSKIISIFLFNIIIMIFVTLIILIISTLIFSKSFNWSEFSMNIRECTKFYSPIKFAILNSATYCFFVTFLSEILGVLIIKIKNRKIVASLVLIYLIVDRYIFSFNFKLINILKYFSLSSYVHFDNRLYYINKSSSYLTVRNSLICSFLLFVVTLILIKVITKFRRVMN